MQTETDLHIAVISHNITLKAIFALIEQRPLSMLRDGPPIAQASLSIARLDEKWQLEIGTGI